MAGERFFLTTLEDVIENVQRFRLPHLKMIVHREQLPISGSKAKLQERIIKSELLTRAVVPLRGCSLHRHSSGQTPLNNHINRGTSLLYLPAL